MTFHLLISGKVQGVFFRATAKERAKELGITGWVRNTTDNNVEILASGDRESLDLFIAWCKKGPPSARVKRVIITGQDDETFQEFSILRNGQ